MDSSSSRYLNENFTKKIKYPLMLLFMSLVLFSVHAKAANAAYNTPIILTPSFLSTVDMDDENKKLSLLDAGPLKNLIFDLEITNNDQHTDDVAVAVKKRHVISSTIRNISVYNVGDINQCSGDPCIAANGENICKALDKGYKRCAANFVKFGTILEIEGYGECLVVDRMANRFGQNVDLAFKYEDRQEALNFGRQNLKVSIVEYTD